ncbi:MAG: LON peptidase substrate-binding domain-containing protein [Alphaproteobacteria bacterium]
MTEQDFGATSIASRHELPATLPIFPLGGVLLLPRAELPLHIFELRYRAMTRDALASDNIIGMIQPVDPKAEGVQPTVYPVGCAGRITNCRKTDDGRYHYTLVGLCRFRVKDELPLHDGYRRVDADYAAYEADLAPPADGVDRARLVALLRPYCEARGLSADWSTVEKTADEKLVSALAMMCPFTPSEKQALLEAPTIADRVRVLGMLMEMTVAGSTDAPPVRH